MELKNIVNNKTYTYTYKVIQGELNVFEKALNKSANEGYVSCGNMNTTLLEIGMWYSQLMIKTTQNK